jgi:hypothetical protein
MRELYEDEASLSKEEQFAMEIERVKGYQLIKLPMVYNADFAAIKPENNGHYETVVGVLELKCRKGNFGRYPSLLISKNKIDSIVSRWNLKKHFFVIAVRWDDVDVYYQWRGTDDHEVVIGGRSDRRDWQDREPVYMIHNEYFKELKAK